jgi:hypothetical protein
MKSAKECQIYPNLDRKDNESRTTNIVLDFVQIRVDAEVNRKLMSRRRLLVAGF